MTLSSPTSMTCCMLTSWEPSCCVQSKSETYAKTLDMRVRYFRYDENEKYSPHTLLMCKFVSVLCYEQQSCFGWETNEENAGKFPGGSSMHWRKPRARRGDKIRNNLSPAQAAASLLEGRYLTAQICEYTCVCALVETISAWRKKENGNHETGIEIGSKSQSR